jgi:hypothetical protein
MKHYFSTAVITAICLAAVGAEPLPKEMKEDPVYQAEFKKLDPAMKDNNEQAVQQQLREIVNLVKGFPHPLVVQAVLYDRAHAQDQKSGWVAPLVFRQLQIDDITIVGALGPYLEIEDKSLNQYVNSLLEGRSIDAYRNFLQSQQSKPSPKIVAMMYKADPEKALDALMKIYTSSPNSLEERRDLVFSAHVVADYIWKLNVHRATEDDRKNCADAIKSLGNSPRWYARVYVLAIHDKLPGLVSDVMMDQLKTDQNNVVRTIALSAPATQPTVRQP